MNQTQTVTGQNLQKWTSTTPNGEYDVDFEAEATDGGLLINSFNLIPWDWIDNAIETKFRRKQRTQEVFDGKPAQ